MGRKPKWSKEQRTKFLAILATGVTITDAALQAGVPYETAKQWAKKANPKPDGETDTPPSSKSGLERGTVPKPTGPTGGASAGSGAGGADAAARAAGVGGSAPTDSSTGGPKVDPSTPAPETPPLPAGEALVFLTAMAYDMTMRAYCIRWKVPFDDEARGVCKFTREEEENLKKWSPYAEPLLGDWLQRYGKYIGAGVYIYMVYGGLADRVQWVKGKAPARKAGNGQHEEEPIHPEDRPRPQRLKVPASTGLSDDTIMRGYMDQLARGEMPTAAPAARAN